MKCPNCSFVNTDTIKTCRVCGFDLTPIDAPKPEETTLIKPPQIDRDMSQVTTEATESTETTETIPNNDIKTSKKRIIDDSEDEALDSAFKSIFGSEDNSEEDSLDVATVERFLQKKRHVQPVETEIQPLETDGSSEDIEVEEHFDASREEFESDENNSSLSKKKVIMMVSLCAILFVLVGLKQLWPEPSWHYKSNIETTNATEIGSAEAEDTTEAPFTLGDDASIKPVNDFFSLLPEFINRGNLSILGLFENSQQALEVLTSFAVIGNLEKIADATLVDSEVNKDSAVYSVKTLTNRLIDGQQTQTESVWDFRVILKNDVWIFESMVVETGGSIITDTTEPVTQETSTEAITEQTEPTKESTTEAATTVETNETLLKGFKSSGNFTGGELSSGQDVAYVRYGNHDTYERLAFDLYEWTGGKPDQPVSEVTDYMASISRDGLTIVIMLNGATEAYAIQSSLDLKNSPNIKEVYYNYYGNGDAVEISILLKQPSQFKVFNLESPAKLVVDIAPIE